jgi:hypothetical protein
MNINKIETQPALKRPIHWRWALIALINLSCTSTKVQPDGGMGGEAMAILDDMNAPSGREGGIDCADDPTSVECTFSCVTLGDCERPECVEAELCLPCEDGGYCAYTGTLTVFGVVKSRSGSILSDLQVRFTCGELKRQAYPNNEGKYTIDLEVTDCEQLTVSFIRQSNTEGYVPAVYRYRMPPPMNSIELNVRLEAGEEIRCDGSQCIARNLFSYIDQRLFRTGYAYNSKELNDINEFGAIFESKDNELLWLHRFIYRDFRDINSNTIETLPVTYYGLSRLNFETRAWVTDLSDQPKAYDYHSQENSKYNENDTLWADYQEHLTDPMIDPDGDGLYDTIDMATYQLNIETGRWELLLDQQGAPLYSHIFATIESGYDTGEAAQVLDTVRDGDNIYVRVPSTYLQQVQTTGEYGPAYTYWDQQVRMGIDGGRPQSRGLYQNDYTGIPHYGSGIFAVGQSIPRACWLVEVRDACNLLILGAPVKVQGVNHGYRFENFTNAEGKTCIEVGRSESENQDFDGDGINNERFDVELSIERPVGTSRLRSPDSRTESTPIQPGSCRSPSECVPLRIDYENCTR